VSAVRVRVGADFQSLGLVIAARRDTAHGAEALAGVGPHGAAWELWPDDEARVAPALLVPAELAEPLVAAIVRHSATADGYVATDARADYLAERARVDLMLGRLLDLAGPPRG
jgi:hypothetical protein